LQASPISCTPAIPKVTAELWESEPGYDPAEAYSDDDFSRILTRTIERKRNGSREILVGFGRFAAQNTFYDLYPAYYDATGSTQEFLLDVEIRIHELVRATAPPRLQVSNAALISP
jgi:heme-NO-binding protein